MKGIVPLFFIFDNSSTSDRWSSCFKKKKSYFDVEEDSYIPGIRVFRILVSL